MSNVRREKEKNNKNGQKINIPPLKNYSSRNKWEEECWKRIKKSENLFDSLLTTSEKRDIVMRAAIIHYIVLGNSYKKISEKLQTSPQTISGIKKAMEKNGYESHFQRNKEEEKNNRKFISYRGKGAGRIIRTKYGPIRVYY